MSQPSPPSSPPTPADLAEILTGDQAALLAGAGPDRLRQLGAVVLPDPFPVPVPTPGDPIWPRPGEPVIETFLVDERCRCEATGEVDEVGAWWQGVAEALAARVVAAVSPLGVELLYPAYVTASATLLDDVTTTPHLDDEGIDPGRGVGLVAIAASHGGPRVALGTVSHRPARPPAPVAIDPASIEAFESAAAVDQSTPADRIVLFPRFGQLHAGPTFTDPAPDAARNLLVFRADTRPRGAAQCQRRWSESG